MYNKNRSCHEEETYNRGYNPCHEDEENDIDIEKTNKIEEAINASINNKGFLIQIGALIIFDDVFDDSGILTNGVATPFELKLDEAGSITINGTKLSAETLKDKTLVVKKA